MEMTMRWYGKEHDTVTLEQIRQTGYVKGIISTLYNKLPGEVWELDEILALKKEVEDAGLHLAGIESVNVSDAIKTAGPDRDKDIAAYIKTLENLGKADIHLVCYNFMPVFDWTRTELDRKREDGSTVMAYNQDVIVGTDELLYLQNWDATEDRKQTVRTVIGDIANAMELRELTKDELSDCITQIIGIYRKAYNFYDQLDTAKLATMASSTGYLLRTRIRAAIEYLDQVQLYGNFSPVTTSEVDSGNIKEEVPEEAPEDPDLEKMLEDF